MYVFGTGIARTLFATELLGGTTVNLAPFGSRAGTCLSQNPQVPLGLLWNTVASFIPFSLMYKAAFPSTWLADCALYWGYEGVDLFPDLKEICFPSVKHL